MWICFLSHFHPRFQCILFNIKWDIYIYITIYTLFVYMCTHICSYIYKLHFILCVFVCICVHMCIVSYMWGSEDNLCELVLSFDFVGLRA